MTASTGLPVDRAQLATFLDATCRYATPGTFLSLRAFYDDELKVFAIESLRVPDNLVDLYPAIVHLATRAAVAFRPIVFAPPLATFDGEFDFRYNTRGMSDMFRAGLAAEGIKGKRLTYRRTGAAAHA